MKYIVIVVLFLILCAVLFLLLRPKTTTKDFAKEPRKNFTGSQLDDSYYQKGLLGVGFKKGVSQARAEEILKSLNLRYYRTINLNMGKNFFYKTGEKFSVRVPDGEELVWLEKLNRMPEIEAAGRRVDPRKALID